MPTDLENSIAKAHQGVDELHAQIEGYQRREEILTDIAFNCGIHWSRINAKLGGELMDHLDGSRGLHERFVQWAREFDAWWEALDEEDDRRENYLIEIDRFAKQKFDAMVVEAKLEV